MGGATATGTTRPDPTEVDGRDRSQPYWDASLPVAARVDDLLGRMGLAEKVGLLFHTVIEAGEDGSTLPGPGKISKTGTREVVVD